MTDHAELLRLYSAAEQCDTDIFAEQRSNILLVLGDHYTKKNSRFLQRLRDNQDVEQQQKLRLTKNHIGRISKIYVNNIVSQSPGVGISANNESELQDQKAAELNGSVWKEIKKRRKFSARRRRWAQNFYNIGEVFAKVIFDYSAGKFQGREQQQNPLTGEITEGPPVFSGDLIWEDVLGYNLLRAPESKTLDDSPYLIIRKMFDTAKLKKTFENDEDKLRMISSTQEETFVVFNGTSYTTTRDQTLLMEFYFRPSSEYPKGWYSIATRGGILFEGELPLGIFPIKYALCDEIEGHPRGRSPIKQQRPCQVEINRGASKYAEHQITVGDDKIVYNKGATLANGALLPGVRGIQVQGPTPTIIPGRSGSQYLEGISANIAELYQIAGIDEENAEKENATDPYSQLYKTIRNKKKFSLYAEKFEEFLTDICETSLDLFRNFASASEIIPIIGRAEVVNISEFKNSAPLSYQIKLEAQNDDLESKYGRLLSVNHVLQYVGQNLDKDDIGKLISIMPYLNEEQAFSDFTRNYKAVTNEILALDRGQYPETPKFFNHVYAMERLSARMLESDFQLLNPAIQENYRKKVSEHDFFESESQRKIQAAKADYIPTDGYFAVCDYYVVDPKDPMKKDRVKVPSRALEWLIQRMQDQGTELQKFLDTTPDNRAQFADFVTRRQGSQGLLPQPGQVPIGGMNVS